MLAIGNGKERDINDWEWLVKQADRRLWISKVVQPPGSALSIIEVSLASHEM